MKKKLFEKQRIFSNFTCKKDFYIIFSTIKVNLHH